MAPADEQHVVALAESSLPGMIAVDDAIDAWRDGDPAAETDLAAIAAVERLRLACENACDTVRQFALSSDDYIHRQIGEAGIGAAEPGEIFARTAQSRREDE